MKLSALFYECTHIPYIHVESDADYALRRSGSTLYIYFEPSNGSADWKNNFDFPAKPYRHMDGTVWFAHRGFLRVWKAIEPYISPDIMDGSVKKIVVTGYSHGAAIAVLCHEYVWYHRPDLRDTLEGYGFGCPRVFWGIKTPNMRRRWGHFTVIRNLDDIVTHVPPAIFGFSHVGSLCKIGERGKYTMIDAHRPENILTELHIHE